jgi:chromosome segregation ATPase
MKTPARPFIISAILTCSAALALSGCQSPKSPSLTSAADAVDSIQKAADDIVIARRQVGVTTASLRNLVDRPQDVPAQYKTVNEQIAKLNADAAKIAAAAGKMRDRGDQYLAEWANQIATLQKKEMQNAAFERRGETAEKLQGIFQRYQTVKAAYIPYQTSIHDIQTLLASDLTAKGLEAAKPYVKKATIDAEPLTKALDELAQSFRETGLSLQPGS